MMISKFYIQYMFKSYYLNMITNISKATYNSFILIVKILWVLFYKTKLF